MLVFPCLFSPVVDPKTPEEQLPDLLRENYGAHGKGYFQRQCDLLHYHVTKGKGARVLQNGEPLTIDPAEPAPAARGA